MHYRGEDMIANAPKIMQKKVACTHENRECLCDWSESIIITNRVASMSDTNLVTPLLIGNFIGTRTKNNKMVTIQSSVSDSSKITCYKN